MACMHNTTFKIYHNDQNILPEGYIAIDELIAPTIQALNQKGYTTRYCCSGHPLNDDWLMIAGEDGYEKASTPLDCYITFAEGVKPATLPPDFVAKIDFNNRLFIRKTFRIENAEDNRFFVKARRILETMERLYEWAESLPIFAGESAEVSYKIVRQILTDTGILVDVDE